MNVFSISFLPPTYFFASLEVLAVPPLFLQESSHSGGIPVVSGIYTRMFPKIGRNRILVGLFICLLCIWVATHTCASLLITTEWSFKGHMSFQFRMLMPGTWCSLNLHLFLLLLHSMQSQKWYLAYVSLNVLYFILFTFILVEFLVKLLFSVENTGILQNILKRMMEEPENIDMKLQTL